MEKYGIKSSFGLIHRECYRELEIMNVDDEVHRKIALSTDCEYIELELNY